MKHRTLMVGANILLIGGQTSGVIDKFFSAEKWNIGHHEHFDITSGTTREHASAIINNSNLLSSMARGARVDRWICV